MKCAKERNHILPFGVIARQFQRALNRFRARVAVVDPVRALHRSDLRQSLCQLHHALVIEISA